MITSFVLNVSRLTIPINLSSVSLNFISPAADNTVTYLHDIIMVHTESNGKCQIPDPKNWNHDLKYMEFNTKQSDVKINLTSSGNTTSASQSDRRRAG